MKVRSLRAAAVAIGAAAMLLGSSPAHAYDICPLALVFDEVPEWSCVHIDD